MKKFPERMEVCAFHGLLLSVPSVQQITKSPSQEPFFVSVPFSLPTVATKEWRSTIFLLFMQILQSKLRFSDFTVSEMFISLVQCYVPSQSIEIWRSLQKTGPLRNTTGVNNEVNFSFCCTIIICWNVWGIYSTVAFKHRNKWVFAFLTEHRVQKPTVCKYSP